MSRSYDQPLYIEEGSVLLTWDLEEFNLITSFHLDKVI